MDISEFGINEAPIGVTLRHPVTGEDLLNDKNELMQIFVVSSDSAAFRRIKSEMFSKNRKAKNVTFDRAEAQALDVLAMATTEFKGLQIDGEEPEYSKQRARDLYQDYPWIKEQVDESIVSRADFLDNSGKG